MKYKFIILSIFLSQTILAQVDSGQDLSDLRKQALEGKADCRGSVYANDTYAYYTNLNTLNVLDLATGKELTQVHASAPITAIKSDGEQLFVLTEAQLEIWDLAGRALIAAVPTHPDISAPYSFYAQPRGLAITKDKIYIAHGIHGVVVMNRENYQIKTVIQTRSTVRDVAIFNNAAVLVLDNNTPDGFHGFALVDLASQQVKKYTSVVNVFPESVTILGDTLLVGYFSTVWKYNTKDVLTQNNPGVLKRVFNFPAGPGSIVGKAHYDDKFMYACYETMDSSGQNPQKSVVVFDRKTIDL